MVVLPSEDRLMGQDDSNWTGDASGMKQFRPSTWWIILLGVILLAIPVFRAVTQAAAKSGPGRGLLRAGPGLRRNHFPGF